MKRIILIFLIVIIADELLGQNYVFLKAPPEVLISENVTIQEYLPDMGGLIAGFRVQNVAGQEKNIHFLSVSAKELMDKLPINSSINISYSEILGHFSYFLGNTKQSGIRVEGIPYLGSPFISLSQKLRVEKEEYDKLSKREKKKKTRIATLVSLKSSDFIHTENASIRKEIKNKRTDEFIENIKILNAKKINRTKQQIQIEGGRTFEINYSKKKKLSDIKSLRVRYNWLYEGEVHEDSEIEKQPEKVRALYRNRVNFRTPVYDKWSRIFGYEGTIDGKETMILFSTNDAKKVTTQIEENGKILMSYTSGEYTRTNRGPGIIRKVGTSYWIEGIIDKERVIAMGGMSSLQVNSPYDYKDTVSFVSEVVSFENTKPEKNDWLLNSYTGYIQLENGYIFNLTKKVLSSFTNSLKVGMKIKIEGLPFDKKEGEVLKEKQFRLIKPLKITIDNITYNLRAR